MPVLHYLQEYISTADNFWNLVLIWYLRRGVICFCLFCLLAGERKQLSSIDEC